MPRDKPRRIRPHITRHNTIQIPPPNHNPQYDAALVDPLVVVGHPGDGGGYGGVDADDGEEGAGVLHDGVYGSNEHGEAGDSHGGEQHVVDAALTVAVAEEAGGDSDDGAACVGRDAEQLIADDLGLVGEAEVGDDGREEEADAVERHERTHVDEHADVGIPVLQGGPDVGEFELLVARAALIVRGEAAEHARAVGVGEELSIVGEVVDEPEGGDGDDDDQGAFEDEDPPPAGEAAEAVHLLDGRGEETAEGLGEGGGGEENGDADGDFVAAVPT